ncbi:hypothetical protein BZA70DRAFT_272458 [Myxozyma melibiosi]|uniref:Uncharacterized protein n=1 Tax=Myxozyma melibiosi TaxID=54550 RepID=A0ABR1FFF5_9ASCO
MVRCVISPSANPAMDNVPSGPSVAFEDTDSDLAARGTNGEHHLPFFASLHLRTSSILDSMAWCTLRRSRRSRGTDTRRNDTALSLQSLENRGSQNLDIPQLSLTCATNSSLALVSTQNLSVVDDSEDTLQKNETDCDPVDDSGLFEGNAELIKLEAMYDQFRIQYGKYPKMLRLRQFLTTMAPSEYLLTPSAVKAYNAVRKILSEDTTVKSPAGSRSVSATSATTAASDTDEKSDTPLSAEEVALEAQFARVLRIAMLTTSSVDGDDCDTSIPSIFERSASLDVESDEARSPVADAIIKDNKLGFFGGIGESEHTVSTPLDDGAAYQQPIDGQISEHKGPSVCLYCEHFKSKPVATAKTVRKRIDSAFILDETIRGGARKYKMPRRGIDMTDEEIIARVRDELRLMEIQGFRFSKKIADVERCEKAVIRSYSRRELRFLVADLRRRIMRLYPNLFGASFLHNVVTSSA